MKSINIVATPIGNLEDISLRAIRILQEVDIIACEDTRVTLKLLKFLKISSKKLISYHNFNEKNSAKGLIELVKKGKTIAQVSDAGTPVVSDPGFTLINEAIKNNIQFEVIPGASAFLTSFVLSNFSLPFTFLGFLKPKKAQREKQLSNLQKGTYIAYLSPHRIIEELLAIKKILPMKSQIFLARELTKKFETHYRDTIDNIVNNLQEKGIKGEFCIVFNNQDKKTHPKKNKYPQKENKNI